MQIIKAVPKAVLKKARGLVKQTGLTPEEQAAKLYERFLTLSEKVRYESTPEMVKIACYIVICHLRSNNNTRIKTKVQQRLLAIPSNKVHTPKPKVFPAKEFETVCRESSLNLVLFGKEIGEYLGKELNGVAEKAEAQAAGSLRNAAFVRALAPLVSSNKQVKECVQAERADKIYRQLNKKQKRKAA